MMESTALRKLHHSSEFWRLYSSRDRRVFLPGTVRACPPVVFEKRLPDVTKTGCIQNNHVVQALPPNRANQSLNVRVLPGGLRSGQDFANSKPSCRFTTPLSIDAIAVAQQKAGRAVPRESFQELPGSPFRRGIRDHSNMNRTPAVVRENHKNKQDPEWDRRNHEEVGGDQGLPGVLQKGAPILRRRLPVPDPVFRHRCLRPLNAELSQLPCMRGAPQRGLARLILWMRSRTSRDTDGRPSLGRLLPSPVESET